MRITVRVQASAKKNEVISGDDPHTFKIKVTTAPEKGKANAAVQKLLAQYFQIPLSKVVLVRGETSQNKIFEVEI